jgi:hypothetical protein
MSLPENYDSSIIIEATSLDDAIKRAKELIIKYNAVIKAVDNIYYGSNKPIINRTG